MKECRICGCVKTLDEFYADKRSKDGKRSDCKMCSLKAKREWNNTNGDKVREHTRRRLAKKRSLAIAALGGKCEACGMDDERTFQIDHRERGGNDERRDKGQYRIYLSILENPAPYQLLCANCHAIKSHEERDYVYKSVVDKPLDEDGKK